MLLYNLYHIIELRDKNLGIRNPEDMPFYYDQKDFVPWGDIPFCYSSGPIVGDNIHQVNYRGFNTIESDQKIDVIVHNAQLPDGTILQCNNAGSYDPGSATYRAGESIKLKPGFQVVAGAYFQAKIEPFDCSNNYRKKLPDTDNTFDDYWNNYYKTNNIETYSNFEKYEYDITDTLNQNLSEENLFAFPNPFTSSTTIQITIPDDTEIKLSIIDLMGNTVQVIYEGYIMQGVQKFIYTTNNLQSGVYICQMEGNNISSQIRLIKL
jgi:hypothetical protein